MHPTPSAQYSSPGDDDVLLSDEGSTDMDEGSRIRLSPLNSDEEEDLLCDDIQLDRAYSDSDSDMSETFDEGYQRRCVVDTPGRKARRPETHRRQPRKASELLKTRLLGTLPGGQAEEGNGDGGNHRDDGSDQEMAFGFPSHFDDDPDGIIVDAPYSEPFADAVAAGECSFIQLSEGIFVASGWDEKKGRGTTQWFHLQRLKDRGILVCTCPAATRSEASDCCHILFLHKHGDEWFPDGEEVPYYDEAEAIMFHRYHSGYSDERYTNIFSVPSPTMPTIRNRAIVQFEGYDDGNGTWRCSKDPTASHCAHIHLGKVFMQKAVGAQESTLEGDVQTLQYDSSRVRLPRRQIPVSYVSRPPPIWACITEDERGPHECVRHLRQEHDTVPIALGEGDACVCSREATYDPSLASETRSCTVYGTERAWTTTIMVQECRLCRRRMIGPDGHSVGLFNWNNKILVTEHLLDDYTNDFVTRETPFTSFATVLTRKYQSRNCQIPFLHEKSFTEIWFGYITLLRLNLRSGDVACPRCGPTPETTIWDGVTVAFSRQHLQPSLEPPTCISQDSPNRPNVVYVHDQQCLPDKSLRQSLRNIIDGPSLVKFLISSGSASISTIANTSNAGLAQSETQTTAQKPFLDRLASIPTAVGGLRMVDTGVAGMFDRWFGLAAIAAQREPPPVYRRLFKQLAAEESVLQMINRPALKELAMFNTDPTQGRSTLLITIPVLYDVACYEFRTTEARALRLETLAMFRWVQSRAQVVMANLIQRNGSRTELQDTPTGCHYTMPQVRNRPVYPHLTHDQRADSSGGRNQKRGVCSKYYSEYSEHRLTGGIMCVWCPHSICYGFHCIPKGEGRNDVFSALYTRWEKAPKRVIYDFACALGPYCLTREPEFFLDTEFRIDSFHAKDHTKCAPATFLATYSATNPVLATINTSAGECGNSSLKKIRKSVSYMSQDRAIIYIHVYLSIWNRFRIKALTKGATV